MSSCTRSHYKQKKLCFSVKLTVNSINSDINVNLCSQQAPNMLIIIEASYAILLCGTNTIDSRVASLCRINQAQTICFLFWPSMFWCSSMKILQHSASVMSEYTIILNLNTWQSDRRKEFVIEWLFVGHLFTSLMLSGFESQSIHMLITLHTERWQWEDAE